MAAAQAMLDAIHDSLPVHVEDTNTYVLGNIKQHNIVIACLPVEQYGTNNAAKVMTNMKRTFSEIRTSLLVGVGGGVPSKVDVRLGDIVVGTRVMQYDLGKIVGDGQLQGTAVPRILHQSFGTVISALRARHELSPSRVTAILHQKLAGHSAYGHPSVPDLLFQATYNHEPLYPSCDGCDRSKLVPRRGRMPNTVNIHYGAIASGNQVMRCGTTRDKIARQFDVICFEMEAAGLMDILPCLIVRGICDYSDSHKGKEWQRYAAATAAAYAREVVEELRVNEASYSSSISCSSNSYSVPSRERGQRWRDLLGFERIHFRKMTIRTADTNTCQWILSHPSYIEWLNIANLSLHHGFFWISGKPGAGKSTIMKFIFSSMRSEDRDGQTLTASFFFNGRGGYLERSVLGMYRSLLLQLLEGYRDLETVLDSSDLVSHSETECPPINTLKDLFRKAACTLDNRQYTCFVDALDECDEQQVIDMVQYFEDLMELTSAKGIPFRICFSSRHYPYIDIEKALRLTLEDQSGHAEDLAIYVARRLRVKDSTLRKELQSQLISKAAGVFMWLVLVIEILNKEYRRGGMSLRKRLAEIPSDLSELFKDMLRRDSENVEALLLCILWILFAKRPLRPKELFHALWSGLSPYGLADERIPDTAALDTGDISDKYNTYVITASKGLAEVTNPQWPSVRFVLGEVTKPETPTVQFIHESVRDFLIKENGLQQIWPEFGLDYENAGHEKLKECCSFYMKYTLARVSIQRSLLAPKPHGRKQISKTYPFLEYATKQILYHANAAAIVVPQDDFLGSFFVSNWVHTNNLYGKFSNHEYSSSASLFYILADKGLSELIRTRLKKDPQIHVFGERYRYPLFAALANGHNETVCALLNAPSSILQDGIDTTQYLDWRDFGNYEDRTPLSWAAENGRAVIVKLLLQGKIVVDEIDRGGRTPLSRASENGHEVVTGLLIDKGAHIDASDKEAWTPLLWALRNGHKPVAWLLVNKGANVNASNRLGTTPLICASVNGDDTVARILIEHGADVIHSDKDGWTPLMYAVMNGHETIARLLINKGADINARNRHGSTPIFCASLNGHIAVVRLLINGGASVNISNKFGFTPLTFASRNGHKAVVELLAIHGASYELGRTYFTA